MQKPRENSFNSGIFSLAIESSCDETSLAILANRVDLQKFRFFVWEFFLYIFLFEEWSLRKDKNSLKYEEKSDKEERCINRKNNSNDSSVSKGEFFEVNNNSNLELKNKFKVFLDYMVNSSNSLHGYLHNSLEENINTERQVEEERQKTKGDSKDNLYTYLNSFQVLTSIISSQINIHKVYGGVVPEVGAREHAQNIHQIFDETLLQTQINLQLKNNNTLESVLESSASFNGGFTLFDFLHNFVNFTKDRAGLNTPKAKLQPEINIQRTESQRSVLDRNLWQFAKSLSQSKRFKLLENFVEKNRDFKIKFDDQKNPQKLEKDNESEREHNNLKFVYNYWNCATETHNDSHDFYKFLILNQIKNIFVTTHPGLVSALKVGLEFAKSLRFFIPAINKNDYFQLFLETQLGLSKTVSEELISSFGLFDQQLAPKLKPINHLSGHVYSCFYDIE